MLTEADRAARFERDGYVLCRRIIPSGAIEAAKREIIEVGNILSGERFTDIDRMYSGLKSREDGLAGLLYDACKRMPGLGAIAHGDGLLAALRAVGCRAPANLDVNFRIDAKHREKYLFDWHQDYWYSVASKNGIVAWIPLTDIDEELGGLDLIAAADAGRAIRRVRRGTKFNSYADAVRLDEAIPEDKAFPVRAQAGDALLFRFDLLHRSRPVTADTRSRWTLQARFSDFCDDEFRRRAFRPASVSKDRVPFLDDVQERESVEGAGR